MMIDNIYQFLLSSFMKIPKIEITMLLLSSGYAQRHGQIFFPQHGASRYQVKMTKKKRNFYRGVPRTIFPV